MADCYVEIMTVVRITIAYFILDGVLYRERESFIKVTYANAIK